MNELLSGVRCVFVRVLVVVVVVVKIAMLLVVQYYPAEHSSCHDNCCQGSTTATTGAWNGQMCIGTGGKCVDSQHVG
ncbi:hypothetical protein E2C01_057309 [Portunus trituberculatus]|uniref:Uncharacterized protein n=1 Tax=Portunus trituberculatus TaxID=210409 RepID=A0A5B7H054_PORTR|nr:hypothetical protein [Portunus trituberculatus]